MLKTLRQIVHELKNHAPFTIFGAILGIALMLIFQHVAHFSGKILFSIFHPGHVILSAMVTTALFRIYRPKTNFLVVLMVGYFGSIGIATLSDSIIPYVGETIMGVNVPMHQHREEAEISHEELAETQVDIDHENHEDHGKGYHFGFIEEWYLVNPAALLGILFAYFVPSTKFPHAAHVLVSTWASSAHVLMNLHQQLTIITILGVFIVLFIAVWLPCCISDIVFPILLVGGDETLLNKHKHHNCCSRKDG
jgi:hypothetical protein